MCSRSWQKIVGCVGLNSFALLGGRKGFFWGRFRIGVGWGLHAFWVVFGWIIRWVGEGIDGFGGWLNEGNELVMNLMMEGRGRFKKYNEGGEACLNI
jgi:hypothetical protein